MTLSPPPFVPQLISAPYAPLNLVWVFGTTTHPPASLSTGISAQFVVVRDGVVIRLGADIS